MALINRLAQDDGYDSISSHTWSAALWLFAKGELTKSNIIAFFNLDLVNDVPQLDQLIAHYQGLTVSLKAEFHSTLESATIALQAKKNDGTPAITKVQYLSMLGMY